jgi:hypothetical protein
MERDRGTGKYPVPFLAAVESTCGTVICLLQYRLVQEKRLAVECGQSYSAAVLQEYVAEAECE